MRMFSLIILFFGIVVIWNSCNVLASECDSPRPEWVFCSDWEYALGNSREAIQDGNKWDDYYPEPKHNEDEWIGVVDNPPLGGPDGNALKIRWEVYHGGDCSDGQNGFVELFPSLPNPFYARIYFYSEHPTEYPGCGGRKFMYFKNSDGNYVGGALYLYSGPGDDVRMHIKNNVYENSDFNTPTAEHIDGQYPWPGKESEGLVTANRWHCIELANYIHNTDGWFKAWLDGKLVINANKEAWGVGSYDTDSGYVTNWLQIPSYRNGGITVAHDEYFDNFVISGSRIGCAMPPQPECTTDGDCSGGQICCSQYCITPPSCSNCDDGDSCTTDSCVGQGTCTPSCQNDPITSCSSGDACCPLGCSYPGDTDCPAPECTINNDCLGGQICCSQQCVNPTCSQSSECGSDVCKDYACSNPGTCSASCSSQDKACGPSDGCCPPGCTFSSDNDCPEGEVSETWGETPDSNHTGTIEDTFINVDANNFATEDTIRTYTWRANEIANAIIVKWDLSAIPQGVVIQDARLYLYQVDSAGDDPYDVSVHRIINYNPEIASATGYTYDGTNSWTPSSHRSDGIPLAQSDIELAEDINGLDTVNGYKNWTVTQMVQYWVDNPNQNYGMLLNSDTTASSDSKRYFASSENSNADQRPKLEITYSVISYHRADTNQDGCVDLNELLAFIKRWKISSQDVPMPELMEAIGLWNQGTGC
jgi:hypothetical protein